jgi:hypothetical protein
MRPPLSKGRRGDFVSDCKRKRSNVICSYLDKANAIQDRYGLDKNDADDYRLRPGGKGRLWLEIISIGSQFRQFMHIAEIIREQWRKIG